MSFTINLNSISILRCLFQHKQHANTISSYQHSNSRAVVVVVVVVVVVAVCASYCNNHYSLIEPADDASIDRP